MTRHRSTAPGYVRPMGGWWRRRPPYLRYMLREGTALFVFAYALVLLAGLRALSQGPQAWAAWVAWLATPPALVLHAACLVAIAYHAVTWLRVLPKTAPDLPFRPELLTRGGYAASLALQAILVICVWVFA